MHKAGKLLIVAPKLNKLIPLGVKRSLLKPFWSSKNIQVFFKAHGTEGQIQTKIDGVLDINYEGDTLPSTGTLIDKIRISTDTDGATKYCYYDDVFVCTGAWPGVIYIERIEISSEREDEEQG